MSRVRHLIADEFGGTLVEYGLLLSLIAVAAISALQFLGGGLQTLFSNVQNDL